MRLESQLKQFGTVPFSHGAIKSLLTEYRRPNDKISTLLADGSLVSLKRGLYALGPTLLAFPISLPLVANQIYGPSYVSSDYALSHYGLIPEGVRVVTSSTTQRAKQFVTPLGRFDYERLSIAVYPIGITSIEDDQGHHYLIASPEKALCDKLMLTANLGITHVASLATYLEEDLRFDMNALIDFDPQLLRQIAQVGIKQPLLNALCRLQEKTK